MRITITALAVALMALSPSVGSAQDRAIHVNLGGGPTFNLGELGDHFNHGWGPAVGVTYDFSDHRFGAQFEYAYRMFEVNDKADALGGRLDASHHTHQLDFNLVANLTPHGNAVRVYAVAGPGAYYRSVEITSYQGTGVVCDPYYYYLCGVYPISTVIGSRGGWDMGLNVGGGVSFRIAEEAEIFLESRFHYVWGPEIVSAEPKVVIGAGGGSTNGQYVPVSFGFRF